MALSGSGMARDSHHQHSTRRGSEPGGTITAAAKRHHPTPADPKQDESPPSHTPKAGIGPPFMRAGLQTTLLPAARWDHSLIYVLIETVCSDCYT